MPIRRYATWLLRSNLFESLNLQQNLLGVKSNLFSFGRWDGLARAAIEQLYANFCLELFNCRGDRLRRYVKRCRSFSNSAVLYHGVQIL